MVVLIRDVVLEPAFVKITLLVCVLVEVDTVVLVGNSEEFEELDIVVLEVETFDVVLETEVTGFGLVIVACVVVLDNSAVVAVVNDRLGGAAGNSREK